MNIRISKYLLMVVCTMAAGCDKCSSEKPAAEQNQGSVAPTPAEGTTANELQITDLKPGNGTEATDGKKVTVHYTGTLTDGTKFDSSRDRNTPFVFTLGSGMVIAGWDMGIKGMRVGGVRKLTIPSHLAYGSRSVGNVIPPNAILIFEVELLNVEDQSH